VEYEIDYVGNSNSHRDGSVHRWADEYTDEDDDMANSVDASTLPKTARSFHLD
jgi:hypothetical protein